MHTHVRVSAYHVACITGGSDGEESPWLPLCSGNPSASPLSLYGWSFLHCCSGLGVQSHEAQVHGHNEVIVNHTVLQDRKLNKKKNHLHNLGSSCYKVYDGRLRLGPLAHMTPY